MSGPALVKLALKICLCSQKDLAAKLGVSPTQISKWKVGEHISFEMEQGLRNLSKIGDDDPELILWAGSMKNARSWKSAIRYLADLAFESSETGYDTLPLQDELDLLCWDTIGVLLEIGVVVPTKPPFDLSVAISSDEDDEALSEAIENDPVFNLIMELYRSLNDVWCFYAAYVDELLLEDALDLVGTDADNIEPCLLRLAASKIDINPQFAPTMQSFRYKVRRDYIEWLTLVKTKAFQSGTPLKAELLDLVYKSHEDVGELAELEALNFNASRIHPDVYMNELLIGMRVIHQVLPAIMKKLEIYDSFAIDESELNAEG